MPLQRSSYIQSSYAMSTVRMQNTKSTIHTSCWQILAEIWICVIHREKYQYLVALGKLLHDVRKYFKVSTSLHIINAIFCCFKFIIFQNERSKKIIPPKLTSTLDNNLVIGM